jgi:hypothetical protein
LARPSSNAASSAEEASGFSTKVCLPAHRAWGGEVEVGEDRRRDHHRVELRIGEHAVELRRARGGGVAPAEPLEPQLVAVTQPPHLGAGHLGEDPQQVRPPVPESDDAEAQRLGRRFLAPHRAAGSASTFIAEQARSARSPRCLILVFFSAPVTIYRQNRFGNLLWSV